MYGESEVTSLAMIQCTDFVVDQVYDFTGQSWSNRTIYFQPILLKPWIFYEKLESNETEMEKAQVCGPMMLMLHEFARMSHSHLKLKRMPKSKSDFIQALLFEGQPDIILTSWSTAQLISYIGQFKQAGIAYRMSHFLAYLDIGTIIARIEPDTYPMFLYFTCIKPVVWMAIFTSLIAISLILAIEKRSLYAFLEYSWNLFVMFFTSCLQNYVSNSRRVLLAFWTLSALIISTQFTGFLLDFMSRPNPVLKIDSLQDLADRPDMKVFAANDSTLFAYATEEDKDPLAVAIRKKIVAYDAESWLDKKFRVNLAQLLRSGKYGFHFFKMTAIFLMLRLINDSRDIDSDEKMSDILHMSTYSGGYLPSAMAISENQEFVHLGIDSLIVSLQESGLYDHWVKQQLLFHSKSNPIINNIYHEVKDSAIEYLVLNVNNFKDIFYLLSFGIVSTILIIGLEIMFRVVYDSALLSKHYAWD